MAGSDHFGAILADSEQNNTIKVDMTDLESEAVKRFLYTGTVYFNNKPPSYSLEILPKLVKVCFLSASYKEYPYIALDESKRIRIALCVSLARLGARRRQERCTRIRARSADPG